MVTRSLLKQEIDRVREEHLTVLYNIIKVFALPAGTILSPSDSMADPAAADRKNWEKFIEETYGCLKDDPIERGSTALNYTQWQRKLWEDQSVEEISRAAMRIYE